MRIVAGSRRGRRLKSPPGLRVRPTPDKVREALFAKIGPRIVGARFLDLYAGTGAVGLEALSRGAACAHFVELSPSVFSVLSANVELLAFQESSVIHAGRLPGCLARLAARGEVYDLIFADPPYERGHPGRLLAAPSLLELAAPGSWLILEMRYAEEPPVGLWRELDRRRYGDTALWFLAAGKREE